MTRVHAARMLLAHGPLTLRDFVIITGWPYAACRRVLSYLVDDLGVADRANRLYRMTDGTELPSLPSAQPEPAFWPGADDLPELLRTAGSQDAARQGASQDHAGRDCPAPRKPAACAGVAAGV